MNCSPLAQPLLNAVLPIRRTYLKIIYSQLTTRFSPPVMTKKQLRAYLGSLGVKPSQVGIKHETFDFIVQNLLPCTTLTAPDILCPTPRHLAPHVLSSGITRPVILSYTSQHRAPLLMHSRRRMLVKEHGFLARHSERGCTLPQTVQVLVCKSMADKRRKMFSEKQWTSKFVFLRYLYVATQSRIPLYCKSECLTDRSKQSTSVISSNIGWKLSQ